MLAGRVSASGDGAELSVHPCPPGTGDNTGIGPRAMGRAGRGGGTALHVAVGGRVSTPAAAGTDQGSQTSVS
jgi:hypothetical protein